jgi:hypothetical protein
MSIKGDEKSSKESSPFEIFWDSRAEDEIG